MGEAAKKLKAMPAYAGGSETGKVVEFAASREVKRHHKKLIEDYQQTRNPALLEEIIKRNQGLLHTILRRFASSPEPYEDLLQVANLGLIKAAQRFDKSRGFEFSSYATAIVDGEIRHYLRDNILMRQPRWLKKAKKRIDSASAELTRRLKRHPRLSELSREANISEDGILEVLRAYAAVGLHSIDDPVTGDEFTHKPDLSVMRSNHHESFTLPIEDTIVLHQALETLGSFHKKIIYLLYFRDLTQTQAAWVMGLSQRKVSRESGRALRRLKVILAARLF